MINDLWLNLPVKDINSSKDFFAKMGFTFNAQYGEHSNSASLLIGSKKVVVMLFDQATFKSFIAGGDVSFGEAPEVLISIGVDSKEEVDELARKAVEAGGTSKHKPTEMTGWMYGCLFSDPDGHKWNVLYMDMAKMPR